MVYREGEKVDTEKDKSSEESGRESALIPKSLLAGMEIKPGDDVLLRVVHVYPDEIEVEYAHAEEREEETEMSGEDKLDKLAMEEA